MDIVLRKVDETKNWTDVGKSLPGNKTFVKSVRAGLNKIILSYLSLARIPMLNSNVNIDPNIFQQSFISCLQRRSSIVQLDPPFLQFRLYSVSPRNVGSLS